MLDLTPIVQPILAVIGAVIAAELAIVVPKALAAFQARTGILLTDQQRAAVTGAVKTAAGVLETRLDQGVLSLAHVNIGNPAVLAQAQAAIAAAPQAAVALDLTVEGVARMIVGAVDTAPRVVVVPTVVAQPSAPNLSAAISAAQQSALQAMQNAAQEATQSSTGTTP